MVEPRARKSILIEGRKVTVSPENTQKLFSAYFAMEDRNLVSFSEMYGIPIDELTDMYSANAWAQKIKDLDDIQNREFEEWSAKRSKKIRRSLTNQLNNLLDSLEDSSLGLPLNIASVNDLKTVAAAYSELVKATDMIVRRPASAEEVGGTTSWSDLLSSSVDTHHEGSH